MNQKLKEYIENHAVVIYSTAIIIGFCAGFGAREILLQNSGQYLSKEKVEQEYIPKKECELEKSLSNSAIVTANFCEKVEALKLKSHATISNSLESVKNDKRKKVLLQTTKEELDFILNSNIEDCSRMKESEFESVKNKIIIVLSKNGLSIPN